MFFGSSANCLFDFGSDVNTAAKIVKSSKKETNRFRIFSQKIQNSLKTASSKFSSSSSSSTLSKEDCNFLRPPQSESWRTISEPGTSLPVLLSVRRCSDLGEHDNISQNNMKNSECRRGRSGFMKLFRRSTACLHVNEGRRRNDVKDCSRQFVSHLQDFQERRFFTLTDGKRRLDLPKPLPPSPLKIKGAIPPRHLKSSHLASSCSQLLKMSLSNTSLISSSVGFDDSQSNSSDSGAYSRTSSPEFQSNKAFLPAISSGVCSNSSTSLSAISQPLHAPSLVLAACLETGSRTDLFPESALDLHHQSDTVNITVSSSTRLTIMNNFKRQSHRLLLKKNQNSFPVLGVTGVAFLEKANKINFNSPTKPIRRRRCNSPLNLSHTRSRISTVYLNTPCEAASLHYAVPASVVEACCGSEACTEKVTVNGQHHCCYYKTSYFSLVDV